MPYYLPSLIEDDALCKAACVVGIFAVWFLTAAADTWEDDDNDDDADVDVTDRTVEVGGGGLFGCV